VSPRGSRSVFGNLGDVKMAFRKLAAASARDILGDRGRDAPTSLSEWFAIARPTHWNDMLRVWNRQHFGETALDDQDLWQRLDEIKEALPRAQRALASVFREHLEHTLVFCAERAYQLGIAAATLSSPGGRPYATRDGVERIPDEEQGRLAIRGPNLLLRGDTSAIAVAVRALSAALPMPVVTWTAGTDVDLPAFDHGTIVLLDVDRLSRSAQPALLRWLDDHSGEVQVIATATSDLFALVTAGAFLESLYYRLNTCVVQLVAPIKLGGVP
jgi:sigma-54-interacting transcriptional regulator